MWARAREGDLVNGATAIETLIELFWRFVIIHSPAENTKADPLAAVLIDTTTGLDQAAFGALTRDRWTQMARYTALTDATVVPVYFANPTPRGSDRPARTPTS